MSFSYVVLGLSITSSWGNGHATTYRALLRGLAARGHRITFLERDRPFYAAHRDLPRPPYATTHLYGSLEELFDRHAEAVRDADLVIVGSFVPEGSRVGAWVTATARGATAFYDIDTPVTLARLGRGDSEYIDRALLPRFDLVLSFTGGPVLSVLERRYGAARARPLYCSVDVAADAYFPTGAPARWDLGYLGTYSADRQPALQALFCGAARAAPRGRFVVAGAQYPGDVAWPANVARIEHVPPCEHRTFYNAQRFTLSVTRAEMVRAGYSPSVRLFEAAACGTPIISDIWPGIDTFFAPGREILLARDASTVLACIRDMREEVRVAIAKRARARVLADHTAGHRAEDLERYTREALDDRARARRAGALIDGEKETV